MSVGSCSSPSTKQELGDACNADSDDMEMKFMSILCTRSFPHLRKGKSQARYVNLAINIFHIGIQACPYKCQLQNGS